MEIEDSLLLRAVIVVEVEAEPELKAPRNWALSEAAETDAATKHVRKVSAQVGCYL